MRPSIESFRAVRWIRTINLVLQAVLVITFCAGLNYLAVHHTWRPFDLSGRQSRFLSAETLSYLHQLAAPVDIYVTLTPNADSDELDQAYRDVHGLLREFTFATEGNDHPFDVHYIDIYRQRREAERLDLEPSAVLVTSGDHRRLVPLTDLYKVEKQEKKGFTGEQAITAAVLDVTTPEKKVIYFLGAHGEMSLDDADPARGLSVLRDQLRARNFALSVLDLTQTRRIPDDAALIVIASPQGPVQPFEQELLRSYLSAPDHAGRVIALLDPARKHGLDYLFADWGIYVDDDLVIDSNPAATSDDGNFVLRYFNADHPVVSVLRNYNLPVYAGACRSVRPYPGRRDDAVAFSPLIQTSPTAWGETSYRDKGPPRFDPQTDLPGPLTLAAASERVRAGGNLPFSVRGGRLLVFGNSDFVSNARLNNPGNMSLVLAAINWATDRDRQLSIPARPIQHFQLTLTTDELARMRLILLGGVPGAAGLVGLLVYWLRRR